MRAAIRFVVFCAIILSMAAAALADGLKARGLSGVPFTEVKFQDEFWAHHCGKGESSPVGLQ